MKIQDFETGQGQHQDRVLQWVKNDRMAGSIPAWVSAEKAAKNSIENQLSSAGSNEMPDQFEAALAYQTSAQSETTKDNSFGFRDLIDMVNPLQHIPLLNVAYREITGDEIKPIGKIIGGAVFGGPMGVAGGIVDAVITQETGKDMAGNAIALMKGDMIAPKEGKTGDKTDLASALLEQPPLPMPEKNPIVLAAAQSYERMAFADDRTAGSIAVYA
jgi:hypothetical protein